MVVRPVSRRIRVSCALRDLAIVGQSSCPNCTKSLSSVELKLPFNYLLLYLRCDSSRYKCLFHVTALDFSSITVLGPTKEAYVGTGIFLYGNNFWQKWPRPFKTWTTPTGWAGGDSFEYLGPKRLSVCTRLTRSNT